MPDPRFTPLVPPTIDYLASISSRGQNVVDVMLTKIAKDLFKMMVYLDDGSIKEYYMEDSADVFPHYREAVQYSGFGSRGLGNLIHADVMEKCRDTGQKQDQFVASVSQELCDRLGKHGKHWTHYGYTLIVDPQLHGMSYLITSARANSQTDTE